MLKQRFDPSLPSLSVRRSYEHMFVHRGPRYTEQEARRAIETSRSYAEALRRLGMCHTGGAHAVLRKYAEIWDISTAHFDPYAAVRGQGHRQRRPLEEILVTGSSFSRNHLKQRLYAEGIKQPLCEICGQGEIWRGRVMSLILDHINGVSDDHRLSNLRIVCPNCAATLDTHCARKRRITRVDQECVRCGKAFRPRDGRQRYCSRECGSRYDRSGIPQPRGRKVDRPPYQQLLREVKAIGYSATGRRYGVSDNAIRKWIRQYERESARAAADDRAAA